jgi:hypothetical protein
MPGLSERLASQLKSEANCIAKNFTNGNRSDCREILENYKETPVTVALLALMVSQRLPIREKTAFYNWLEALAT